MFVFLCGFDYSEELDLEHAESEQPYPWLIGGSLSNSR